MPNTIYKMIGVFACCILLSAGRINAQVNNSVYSMFGIGSLTDNNYGINKSFGGTGIAFQSDLAINYLNPASYASMRPNSFNLEIGAYEIVNTAKLSGASQTDADFNFSYFTVGWYLNRHWAFCLGLSPYSSVDYDIDSIDEIEGEPITFAKRYSGSGGLSRIYLGNAFNLFKGLSVGFDASFILGVITENERALSDGDFSGYEFNSDRSATGGILDFGAQYTFDIKRWQYTLGLTYSGKRILNTEDSREFIYNNTIIDLEEDEDSDVEIPEKWGVGLALRKENVFRIGVDYERKNWSGVDFSDSQFKTDNSTRLSAGLEYAIVRKEKSFQNIYLRMGASYKESYLVVHKTPIDLKALTLGVGIPFSEASHMNFTVEYGQEGTLNKGLVKNNYWIYYLNFSLHQFWTRRTLY